MRWNFNWSLCIVSDPNEELTTWIGVRVPVRLEEEIYGAIQNILNRENITDV
jgi:hypothetical protein